MSEKKKGLMWKPPIEITVGDEKITILGFMPLPAALCLREAYGTDNKMDPKKITPEILYYFLKQCVIDPIMDDDYLKNSDSSALMSVFEEIIKRVQSTRAQLREIKKTMPTKP